MDINDKMKIEKVKKGLYECQDTNGNCSDCPYVNTRASCRDALLFDIYCLVNRPECLKVIEVKL